MPEEEGESSCGAKCGTLGAAGGEDDFSFFHGVGLSASLGREALFEHGAKGVPVGGEPVSVDCLSFEEVEGVGERIVRAGVGTGFQLALEAGFGGG